MSTSNRISEFWRRRPVLLWAGAAVLLAGAVLYHVKGLGMMFGPTGGDDYHQRWIEVHYAAEGRNPYDVYRATFGRGPRPWSEGRDTRLDPALGYVYEGGYPPWAFVSGWLFVWPPWPAALWYNAALSIAAAAVVGCWAASLAPPTLPSPARGEGLSLLPSPLAGEGRVGGGLAPRAFLFAAAVAVNAYCTTLEVGQYGALVVACLAGSLWLTERGRHVLGGLLLGVALLKPTIAGPFLLALLVRRRFTAAAVAVLYVVAAAAAVWVCTHTNPVEMCLQMLASGGEYLDDSQGLVGPLLALGLSRQLVTPVLAVGILVPAVALMVAFRRRGLTTLFAVAAVAARLWSYHKSYDDMMLVFLLAPLLAAWLRRPASLPLGAAALLAGASLWAPAGLLHVPACLAAQMVIWLSGLCVLLLCDKAESPAPAAGGFGAPGRQPASAAELQTA